MTTAKVLLVDDRPENLYVLRAQLRDHAGDLLSAGSAREALDLLLTHEVAVAIIDVQMPDMDGFELAELMRASPRTREIPIILVTAGLHDHSRIFHGYEAGAVDFLVRPIEPQILRSKVDVFLQLFRQRKELAARIAELEQALVERRQAEEQLAADHAALLRLHQLGTRLLDEAALPDLLQAALEAAMALTGADKATFRQYDPGQDALRVVAEVGFAPPLGEELVPLQKAPPACTEAVRRRGRLVVEDVRESEIFRGTPMLAVMEAAGVRALQATPLVSRRGALLGVLSTHWRQPHVPSDNTLRLLDLLARQAADLIEYRQREESLTEANARLLEESRRKNAFLATLSHELRNPLAPIVNSLYVLGHAPPAGEQANRAKAVIARQVSQLTNLVNDLLDVTRVTSNKIVLHRETLELGELVRRAVEDCRFIFEKAEIALRLEPPPAPIFLAADGTRIAQVVSNLLHNAAKFTPRGGATRVSVEAAGGEAVIRVRDTGVGIKPETLARLFEPFVQAEQTLARSSGGLGLGLALVKGLTELHGGRVSAHSEGLGRGAEFVVRLPLDAAAVAGAATASAATPAASKRRILIIEDNIDAADTLREVLELAAHEVEVAYNGPDGLAKARSVGADVVLCDIGLPGMDGFEVVKVFQTDPRLRQIPVVALTGYALPDDIERALRAGFVAHLAKPPSLPQLTRLLAELPRPPAGVRG